MAPISLVAWIPALRTDREIEHSQAEIDRLLGSYAQAHPMYDPVALQKIGQEWKRRMVQYLPPYPAHTWALTAEADQIRIVPVRYRCTQSGMGEREKGWEDLLNHLMVDPLYRVAQLGTNQLELYEVRSGIPKPIVRVDLIGRTRVKAILDFGKTIGRMQEDQTGPLITRSSAEGVHELDLFLINKQTPILQSFISDPNTRLQPWCKQIDHCQLHLRWREQWIKNMLTEAESAGKWLTNARQIKESLLKNKVNALIICEPENDKKATNNLVNADFFSNNLHLHPCNCSKSGAILK